MTSVVGFLHMNRFDIVQIYRQYCDIRSQNGFCHGSDESGHEETQLAKSSKQALAELLIYVQSSLQMGNSVVYELSKLMSYLNLTTSQNFHASTSLFSLCVGRMVKKISLLVWQLEHGDWFWMGDFGYLTNGVTLLRTISDTIFQRILGSKSWLSAAVYMKIWKGAWPVLIDDFVEHMYRRSGSKKVSKLCCNCGDSQSQPGVFEDPLSGLKFFPGLKRKLPEDMQMDGIVSLSDPRTGSMELSPVISVKKSRFMACRPVNLEINLPSCTADENIEMVRHNTTIGSKSPCAVEGCLSKGFAGLFSTRLFLGLDQERKASFT